MRLLPLTALLTVINLTYAASDSTDKTPWQPCTAESTTSGNFFDINPLQIQPPSSDSPSKSKKKDNADLHSWHARGYDYHANFTLNFCGPVVEKLDDVEDLQKSMWKNVSAYYEKSGRTYAIGLESQEPVIRGRKLVLNYTHGSLCPAKAGERRGRLPVDDADPRDEDVGIWRGKDDDDEDEDDGKRRKGNKDSERRKSTIISLLCERNPKDGDPLVTVSYVGSVDECTYFFEARSTAACATTKVANQPLGPGSVFGIMYAFLPSSVYLELRLTNLQCPRHYPRLPHRWYHVPAHRAASARMAPAPELLPLEQHLRLRKRYDDYRVLIARALSPRIWKIVRWSQGRI